MGFEAATAEQFLYKALRDITTPCISCETLLVSTVSTVKPLGGPAGFGGAAGERGVVAGETLEGCIAAWAGGATWLEVGTNCDDG